MKYSLLGLFVLYSLLGLGNPLYFHIKETEKKCFIEEVPDETLVVGKYKVQIFDKESNQYLPTSPGIGMHVEVKDPEQNVVLSKVIHLTTITFISLLSHIYSVYFVIDKIIVV
jgi:hypothetical protein